MTTLSPVLPEFGLTEEMLKLEFTVKFTPLLAVPPTVTTTLPVVAPVGTSAVIKLSLQLVAVAVVPLNFTVLEPWLAPNPAPVIATLAPIPPLAGDRLVIPGPVVTVNVDPLLVPLPTVTRTGPVVAPAGTGTLIRPVAQLVGDARTPLKVITLAPCVDPKFDPLTLTIRPTGPVEGERLEMAGDGTTVNFTPLLAVPPTVTTTLPVVAVAGTVAVIAVSVQFVAVAVTPLKVIVLVP